VNSVQITGSPSGGTVVASAGPASPDAPPPPLHPGAAPAAATAARATSQVVTTQPRKDSLGCNPRVMPFA
jgi:hypothetical protein